ncbi:ATP-dependent 6-phosphofructokinase [Brachybacterium sp. EF45031]|uniref:6-phosphofructokinase n=1 Tax=Brachybacterium sillae TaxID=2810536 RepID=UPI00217CDCDF|nr:ATP-dependent 6-phosphofructokinase [Brachybacterium sillae]MCS6712416.1 ATP-dependent 6-phosphofructokinase [Brachybacterium sillae]
MKIGILTSGGDCPGLNAVIRGAVLTGDRLYEDEFVGFRDGWRGVFDGDVKNLPRRAVRGIGRMGGTILGTSRANPFHDGQDGAALVAQRLEEMEIDAIIAIGGDGTLYTANRLVEAGVPVVGVPKTVDNDLDATDYTFGFDTAVQIATESLDRLRMTGDSHHRCMIAEVMGRSVGWIALHSGMASGAHVICLPEFPLSLEEIADHVRSARDRGRAPLVVVAEGFVPRGVDEHFADYELDEFGRPRLGGIAQTLAPILEEMAGIETRATVLGHIQRGGEPTGFDRVLATRLGSAVVHLLHRDGLGRMVALRGTDIVDVPLSDAIGRTKRVPQHRWDEVRVLFG